LNGSVADNNISVIHHSSRGFFSIGHGDWKYIEGLGSGGFSQPTMIEPSAGGPDGQLYNLHDDPSEQIDLFMTHQEKVKELRQRLEEIRN
jgi:arylsulfatase A